jgi:hypothetical protein
MPGAASGRTRDLWAKLLVAVVFLAASARIGLLIDRYAVNVLFWDQWEIWQAFFDDASAWELFRWRHGPHRQGLGFWLTRVVADLSGWNTRAEAFMIGAVTCASAAAALGLRVRLLGPLRWWDVALPILMLTPAQYGIYIHTPNVSHSALPLLLVLAAALVWTLRSQRWRLLSIAPLTFVAIHTGFAVFVGLVTPCLVLVEAVRAAPRAGKSQEPRAREPGSLGLALGVLIASLLSLLYFFVDYPLDVVQPPDRSALFYYRYAALMFANLFGIKGIAGAPLIVGGFLLVGAVGTLALQIGPLFGARGKRLAVARSVFSLVGFSLAYGVAAAVGRGDLGLPGAQSSRYVPLVLPAFVGMYLYLAFLLERVAADRGTALARGARHAVMGAVVVATLAATIPMRAPEAQFMRVLSEDKREWAKAFRETGDIAAADRAAGRRIHPASPEEIHLREKLRYLQEHQLNLFLPTE